MQFHLPEPKIDIISLYKILDEKHFAIIKSHQYRQFPIRFFTEPDLLLHFKLTAALCEAKAVPNRTFVIRFLVNHYDFNKLSAVVTADGRSIVINRSRLEQLNKAIIGYIECVRKIDPLNSTNQFAF